jgi:hypothetical protein
LKNNNNPCAWERGFAQRAAEENYPGRPENGYGGAGKAPKKRID